MDGPLTYRAGTGVLTLELTMVLVGRDVLLYLQGGEQPHLGSVVQAVPRPSLTGDGSNGVTSSVLNLTGHKDEYLCRQAAELVCRATGRVTVCTGGFHVDGLTAAQADAVCTMARQLAERAAADVPA